MLHITGTTRIQKMTKFITASVLCIGGLYSVYTAIKQSEQLYNNRIQGLLEGFNNSHILKMARHAPLIAHGGGINQYLYTNSAEAVADSLNRGFSFIELDLCITSDGHILAAHDWKHFRTLTGSNNGSRSPLSLPAALKLKISKAQLRPLSGDNINEIMSTNQDFILVTDKITNFELLLREIPFPDRMIVEVFSPLEYERALKAGVKYPAFCICHPAALQQACIYEYPFVTIDASLFLQHIDTMQQLHKKKVCIMVYGTEQLDTRKFAQKYIGSAASLIYTGNIEPQELNNRPIPSPRRRHECQAEIMFL